MVEESTTNSHYDILESWLFWKKRIDANPEKYGGYKFPDSIQSWESIVGTPCPICDGATEGPIDDENGDTINIKCVCGVLMWLQQRYYAMNNYESPMQPAHISDLKLVDPLMISDEVGMMALIKYLEGTWFKKPQTSWITIEGPNGTGKTHIMRAIKTHFDGLCAYISADQFQHALFSSLQDKEDGVNKLIKFVSTIPILLIDDWGIEHDNGWTTDTIASIVNYRYAFPRYFPTVFSFNHSREQLLGMEGLAKKRIISRIFDVNISARFAFNHKDYRDEKTPKKEITRKASIPIWGGKK